VTLSKQLLDRGIDAILGCSGRAIQPIGHIFTYASWRANDKYVAYSLGDFLSVQESDDSQSGLIAYLHLEKRGLRTYVTGVSYLPVYVQESTVSEPAKYRVLPVHPSVEPSTDVPLTSADRVRMAEIWEEARSQLYRPDESISPLSPIDLGL
jgi:hypothetical protein